MILEIIKLIKQNYETIPYHNFWLVLGLGFNPTKQGGICTDKNYYFYKQLKEKGFSVSLQSAQINGQNIHQLIRINIEQKLYLIDVGLGWPIMEPIPLFRNSRQKAFGIEFSFELDKKQLCVYKIDEGKKLLNYITNIAEYKQDTVLSEIMNSYDNSIDYPFRKSIRYSRIVDDEFYFLKGDILYYSVNNNIYNNRIVNMENFESLFLNKLGFDLNIVKQVAKKLKMYK